MLPGRLGEDIRIPYLRLYQSLRGKKKQDVTGEWEGTSVTIARVKECG